MRATDDNPFEWSGVSTEATIFLGRDDQRLCFQDCLAEGGRTPNLVMSSPSGGYGKTVLAHVFRETAAADGFFVLNLRDDGFALNSAENIVAIIEQRIHGAASSLAESGTAGPDGGSSLARAVAALYGAALKRGYVGVLLECDEAHSLYGAYSAIVTAVTSFQRTHGQSAKGHRLHLLLYGTHADEAFDDGVVAGEDAVFFARLRLPPFTPAETVEFLRSHFALVGLDIDEWTSGLLWRATKGHPRSLAEIGGHLCESVRGSADNRITPERLKRVAYGWITRQYLDSVDYNLPGLDLWGTVRRELALSMLPTPGKAATVDVQSATRIGALTTNPREQGTRITRNLPLRELGI